MLPVANRTDLTSAQSYIKLCFTDEMKLDSKDRGNISIMRAPLPIVRLFSTEYTPVEFVRSVFPSSAFDSSRLKLLRIVVALEKESLLYRRDRRMPARIAVRYAAVCVPRRSDRAKAHRPERRVLRTPG